MELLLLWLGLCVGLLPSIEGQTMKINIVHLWKPQFGLFCPIRVKGQPTMNVLIDTGSDSLFFVWNEWFENSTAKSCGSLPSGCYKCEQKCSVKEPINTMRYKDGLVSKVFQHEGEISVGATRALDLTFGLQFYQNPPPTKNPPVGSFGLRHDTGNKNFPSVMRQLQAAGRVRSPTFALALFPADPAAQEVKGIMSLGGGDSSLYKGPLQYVPFRSPSDYVVDLYSLQVGGVSKTVRQQVLLDTGSNFFYVPKAHFATLISDINDGVNKASGSKVAIKYDSAKDLWSFPCKYITLLPPLVFELGSTGAVKLTMNYFNYAKNDGGSCYLVIQLSSSWIFPDRMLIGNYFEFQPNWASQGRVGIAALNARGGQ